MSTVEGWECRLVGTDDWRPVPVPGSWEQTGIPLDHPGPVDYRATFDVPVGGARLRLRFGAVSYACEVLVNGRVAGQHVGMWDAFEVDITGLVTPGQPAEVLVRAEKPASLTGGPDAPPVPGRYPARETLAGFLPYVWGHSHGGVWRPVELLVTGECALGDVDVSGTADGRLSVAATLLGPGELTVSVRDPSGVVVARSVGNGTLTIPDPRPWSPHDPALYAVTVHTSGGDSKTVYTGLRTLEADGSLLRLNGEPLYPRMILSWGWYPDQLHPDPGPERVRADLIELRRLGFNGVKLCLWFPPDYYFAIADELGMLLWVELPMWLPHPTPHFRTQLFAEASRLVRAAANHPSVILLTLGCELSSAVGADVLGPLYDLVKRLAPGTLVRDNSGSGEAYGGLLDEFADFDDHHFYCEPAYFRGTLDHFAPRWRAARPWLFGEFCDLDTFRDLRRLDSPWWTSADPAVNPQGARWQYDVPDQEKTLRGNGFWDRGAELERISARQAVLHRKVTLEAVRVRADTSGYVITGERDTPISTAGLFDDSGALKVDAASFAQFNADLVVGLDWDRRRAWTAGGDRPAPWDTWCHPAGALVRPHLVLAHHGRTGGRAEVRWRVDLADGGEAESAAVEPGAVEPGLVKPGADASGLVEPGLVEAGPVEPGPDASGLVASGSLAADIAAGAVAGLGIAAFTVPAVDRPRRAVLRVEVDCAGQRTSNSWSFWFLPDRGWPGPVAVVDPAGRLTDLAALGAQVVPVETPGAVLLATAWTEPVRQHLRAGGNAVLLVDAACVDPPLPVAAMPFWREAVKVIEPHEAWGDFPHDGWTDLQFAGMAPDLALDVTALPIGGRPLLRRVDTRTSQVHDYAVEVPWSAGRLIVSTLRFDGSGGDQPLGLRRNTSAAYLLGQWVRALGKES